MIDVQSSADVAALFVPIITSPEVEGENVNKNNNSFKFIIAHDHSPQHIISV